VTIFLAVGLVLSPLAGVMVFLITYDEYVHHFSERGRAFQYALRAAVVALVFFLVIIAAAGLIFVRWVTPHVTPSAYSGNAPSNFWPSPIATA
jgi:uncharacterized membrane protein